MRKRFFLTVGLFLILMLSMCGCALVPTVDLTENEQRIIAEYAAGLLLSHDRNYTGNLVKYEEEDSLDLVEEPEYSEPEDTEGLSEGNEDESTHAESGMDESLKEPEGIDYSDKSMSEALGLSDFQIIYKSYNAYNIYPPEEDGELIFSLQAQNGMELLVLEFGITNDSDSRKLCDILDADASYRLLINGSERVSANKTILLNDLSSYKGEIDGYGMDNAVLVFEVSEGTTNNIDSLDLIIKRGDETTNHKLH